MAIPKELDEIVALLDAVKEQARLNAEALRASRPTVMATPEQIETAARILDVTQQALEMTHAELEFTLFTAGNPRLLAQLGPEGMLDIWGRIQDAEEHSKTIKLFEL